MTIFDMGNSFRDLFRKELDEHQMVLEFRKPGDFFHNAVHITIRRRVWGEISHQWKTVFLGTTYSLEPLMTEREMMGRIAQEIERMIVRLASLGSGELVELLDKWILHDNLANIHKRMVIDWRPQESLPEDYYN